MDSKRTIEALKAGKAEAWAALESEPGNEVLIRRYCRLADVLATMTYRQENRDFEAKIEAQAAAENAA